MGKASVFQPANDHPPAIVGGGRTGFVVGRMEEGWLRFYPDDLTLLARQLRCLALGDIGRDPQG